MTVISVDVIVHIYMYIYHVCGVKPEKKKAKERTRQRRTAIKYSKRGAKKRKGLKLYLIDISTFELALEARYHKRVGKKKNHVHVSRFELVSYPRYQTFEFRIMFTRKVLVDRTSTVHRHLTSSETRISLPVSLWAGTSYAKDLKNISIESIKFRPVFNCNVEKLWHMGEIKMIFSPPFF